MQEERMSGGPNTHTPSLPLTHRDGVAIYLRGQGMDGVVGKVQHFEERQGGETVGHHFDLVVREVEGAQTD
jgi:hypothetical protein